MQKTIVSWGPAILALSVGFLVSGYVLRGAAPAIADAAVPAGGPQIVINNAPVSHGQRVSVSWSKIDADECHGLSWIDTSGLNEGTAVSAPIDACAASSGTVTIECTYASTGGVTGRTSRTFAIASSTCPSASPTPQDLSYVELKQSDGSGIFCNTGMGGSTAYITYTKPLDLSVIYGHQAVADSVANDNKCASVLPAAGFIASTVGCGFSGQIQVDVNQSGYLQGRHIGHVFTTVTTPSCIPTPIPTPSPTPSPTPIPTPSPTPTPSPSPSPSPAPTPSPLVCTPTYQTVNVGGAASFAAAGGGTYPGQGYYLWSAPGGSSSTGIYQTFSTQYGTSGVKEVAVTRNGQTAQCFVFVDPVPYPTPTPGALSCSPSYQSVVSGQMAHLTAAGGSGFYSWSAPGGYPSHGIYRNFDTQYFVSGPYDETRTITVTNNSQSADCSVHVIGQGYPTPTPYYGYLNISKTVRNVSAGSGEMESVSASPNDTVEFILRVSTGSSGTVNNVRVSDSLPYNMQYMSGTTTVDGVSYSDGIVSAGIYLGTFQPWRSATVRFQARLYGDSSFSSGSTTLTNIGYVSSDATSPVNDSASVIVNKGQNYIYGQNLSIQKLGRNITRGQADERTSVSASANDTLEFIIRVRSLSNAYVYNINVSDVLPGGLQYLSRTTSVNGSLVSDGITSGGINIGSLSPNQEAVVRFSAQVLSWAVPSNSSTTLVNTVQVRADSIPTLTADLPIVLGLVLGAATKVPTGTDGAVIVALLISGLVTYGYVRYTETPLFARRRAVATVNRFRSDPQRLNFRRFL